MSSVRRRSRLPRGIAAGFVGLALMAAAPSLPAPAAARQFDLRQEALRRVGARLEMPASTLRVVAASSERFPLQHASVHSYKVLDPSSGLITDITLDDSGRSVDFQRLLAQEQARWIAENGTLDPTLVERLAFAPPDDLVSIAITVRMPPYAGPSMPTVAAADADKPAVLAATRRAAREAARASAAAIRAAVDPVLARLRDSGYPATSDRGAAIVHTSLPPAAIARIATWTDVLRVYEEGQAVSSGDVYQIVRPTVGVDYLQSISINGSGIKVAQDEVGGAVNQSNPYLTNVILDSLATLCYPSYPAFNGHATAVAGMIRYTAPGSSILATGSCGGGYPALQDRALGAINWGAAVVNHSWGESRQGGADNLLDSADFYFDSLMINYGRLQVFAAGNDGQASGNVGSPGSAYNVLTVGNFDDKGTVSWTGDTMYATSSFRDPLSVHNDREKPEVSAPGANDNSTTIASPWWGPVGSGTSYAAPIISGIAALMFQRAPALINYPVATKAIIMATAIHNVEGVSRLSEYDGTGATWAPYADNVSQGVNGSWTAYNWSCSQPDTNLTTMALTAGKRTRVAIAWNTDPNYQYYWSQPSADFDLNVIGPSSTVVASSVSWDNTYEIVDFTPTVSGTYTLQVHKARCDVSPRTLAYAWFRQP